MVVSKESNEARNIPIPQIAEERKILWRQCLDSCKGNMSRAELSQIVQEVYGDFYEPFSDSDSEPESSGSPEILMEMKGPLDEVLRYKKSSVTIMI